MENFTEWLDELEREITAAAEAGDVVGAQAAALLAGDEISKHLADELDALLRKFGREHIAPVVRLFVALRQPPSEVLRPVAAILRATADKIDPR